MRFIGIVLALTALLIFPLWSRAADSAQAAPPAAPAETWNIDPAHCSVNFTVRHIYVKIPGRFATFTGTIRFDPENLAGSSIAVAVQIASVDTFVDKRDEDLRSPNFFDAARYPSMTFTSREIVSMGGDAYVANGTLTIKDVSRDIALPFTYLGKKKNPLDPTKTVAGFESLFPVKLLDYHVGDEKWQRMGALGDTADIALYMELLR